MSTRYALRMSSAAASPRAALRNAAEKVIVVGSSAISEPGRLGSVVCLASVMAAFSFVGCGKHSPATDVAATDDYAISMPLASSNLGDETLVATQPPSVPREIVPAPPGKIDQSLGAKVKSELVPTPPGKTEPPAADNADGATPVVVSGNSSLKSDDVDAARNKMVSPEPKDGADEVASAVGSTTAPEEWSSWPDPQAVLFVTGNQHGYIEPCGCTGLENQKGGMARRFTLMKQVSERGWPLVPLDAGNQVRRTGRQAEVKFQTAATGLAEMNYQAIGFGPDDLRLGVGELIAVAASDDPSVGRFVSANVVLIDPSLMAQFKVIESGGRRIGVTSVLDPKSLESAPNADIQVGAVNETLTTAIAEIRKQRADFNVLMFYGDEEAAAEAVKAVPGFDLVVVGGGYGEPTYQAQSIEGSQTKMIVTGNKGMYAGMVGIYPDGEMRYARVALTHEFGDAPEMRRLMASYQEQLQSLGLEGLGLKPVAHPTGEKFVGTKVCGECHKTAMEIWENSSHALATEHIVNPGERGDVPRHFDPECISCHVTGWNPQNYYPYDSGYLSLEASSHLTGNGCENCHGPGASHVAAEREGSTVSEAQREALRLAMQLPLESAKERCMECHDLDNSPDFHKEGAFEDYWAEIEHYGVD